MAFQYTIFSSRSLGYSTIAAGWLSRDVAVSEQQMTSKTKRPNSVSCHIRQGVLSDYFQYGGFWLGPLVKPSSTRAIA